MIIKCGFLEQIRKSRMSNHRTFWQKGKRNFKKSLEASKFKVSAMVNILDVIQDVLDAIWQRFRDFAIAIHNMTIGRL